MTGLDRLSFALRTLQRVTAPAALRVLASGLLAGGLLASNAGMVQADPASGPAVDHTLSIELNEGQLLKLEKPVNSVFIANPDVADVSVKSSRLIYIFGKAPGETTLYAVDKEENIVVNRRVRITHNLSRLNNAINEIVPGGGVRAVSVDGGILIRGAVPNPVDSENIKRVAERFLLKDQEVVNQVAVTMPTQVNLRVRVAEVQKIILNEFGFSWDAAFDNNDIVFGIATGSPVNPLSISGDLISTFGPLSNTFVDPFIGTFVTRRTLQNESIFGSLEGGSYNVDGLVDALAEDGLITLLAEPNLTAVSGETASFLAGGEFPIVVSETNDRIRIEFKQFGVSLAFTPTVLSQNRMSLRVRPEVSQLSDEGAIRLLNFEIPALRVRRAETTVELASGQSFGIAGMRLNNSRQDIDEVPGLRDLPVLGPLFRSDRYENNETELVIIVTPYLVRPSNQRMALPTDPYLAPSEPTASPTSAAPQTGANLSTRHTIPLATVRSTVPNVASSAGFILE